MPRDLTVSAPLDGERVPVISDLSFSLQPGKVLGLVGESGAGKSMVGRTVAQAPAAGFAVTDGSLAFAGNDLVRMAPEARRALLGREIAFIPQEPLSALNPVLTDRRSSSTSTSRASALRRATGATACSRRSTRCICRTAPTCSRAIRISSPAACASAC